jgi:hypothetical protein
MPGKIQFKKRIIKRDLVLKGRNEGKFSVYTNPDVSNEES